MIIKKFKVFLASNIEKEEQWLTEMSSKGLHLVKYRLCFYYFEKDIEKSYVYQTDFRPDADDDYFQLYRDAGWEHIDNALNLFHYFRTDSGRTGIKKLYSDEESIKDSYSRMMRLYISLFIFLLVSQIGLVVTWEGYVVQIIAAALVIPVIILYVYMFWSFKRKLKFYKR